MDTFIIGDSLYYCIYNQSIFLFECHFRTITLNNKLIIFLYKSLKKCLKNLITYEYYDIITIVVK